MSRQEKLLDRLKRKPQDFTWDELVTLMGSFGYRMESNSGSSRKFFHPERGLIIRLHQPHPRNELKAYQVREILAHLKEEKFL